MLPPEDRLRAKFQVGDRVSFPYRRKMLAGVIIRLNPKRAIVQNNTRQFSVSYDRLNASVENSCERIKRLESVQSLARSLLREHGLKRWVFGFDHSTRRAGCCNYQAKRISIALDLAANGSENDIRDTLLHEIAHALVGRRHHHDAVWNTKALEIGASGERTHRLQFSKPRWSVTCENRCWTNTAQRRNRRLICRRCGSPLVYTPYEETA